MADMHTQDVTSREDGRLIGRAFVSSPALLTLQGSISATLISPQLEMVRKHLLTSPQSRHHSWLLQRSPQRRQCALLCSVMCSGGNQDQQISCAFRGCKSGLRRQVGAFKAGFLVVTSLEHPYNNLGDLQRAKWSPALAAALGTLDIG